MKTPRSSLRRYYETVRHLHPEQVRFQVQRRLLPVWRRRPPLDTPEPFRERLDWGLRARRCRLAPQAGALDGAFRWWGQDGQVNLQGAWLRPEHGLAWNYMVQYCEYLGPWADRVREEPEVTSPLTQFIDRWIDAHPPGTPVAWDPYPTALRIVAWLDVVHTLGASANAAWRERVLRSIYVQTRWLSGNLERHLLGTHLLKDIKALLVSAACFEDARARAWRDKAHRLLVRELGAQINADGAHVEPSLMYHCVALEDLLDLLNYCGAVDDTLAQPVALAAARMLRYARATQTPPGGTALLGDAWDGGAPSPSALLEYAARLGVHCDDSATESTQQAGQGMVHFAASGVAVWRDAHTYLIADVGDIGPPHLAGHGHCDSLSFELWMMGEPWLVDSGTWAYDPGDRRLACRSTRAHNTLEVDAQEQHEIWHAFRVARRSAVQVAPRSTTRLEATLIPWFDRRLRVSRSIDLCDARVEVADRVDGPGNHTVCSRFHVHPDCDIERDGDEIVLRRGQRAIVMQFSGRARCEVRGAEHGASGYARAAGEVQPNAVIEIHYDGALPFQSTVTIRRLP